MHGQRISIRYIAGLAYGLVAVDLAVAAPSMGDVDWESYFNWHSYTEWHSLVLIGSIALLIVALLVKIVEAAKSAGESDPIPTPGDRIGTMPIEPPESIASDGDDARVMQQAVAHGRERPVANFDVA